jgi:hypothetical protein
VNFLNSRRLYTTILQVGFARAPTPNDALLTCANGKQVPRSVARACIHMACLASGDDAWPSAGALLDAVISGPSNAAALGLEDTDIAAMLKCRRERVYAAGVHAAPTPMLYKALGMFGPSPQCLAMVCARLRDTMASFSSASGLTSVGSLRRAAAAVESVDAGLAKWLVQHSDLPSVLCTHASGPLVGCVRIEPCSAHAAHQDSESQAGASRRRDETRPAARRPLGSIPDLAEQGCVFVCFMYRNVHSSESHVASSEVHWQVALSQRSTAEAGRHARRQQRLVGMPVVSLSVFEEWQHSDK